MIAVQLLAADGHAGMTGRGLVAVPFWLIALAVVGGLVYVRSRRQ